MFDDLKELCNTSWGNSDVNSVKNRSTAGRQSLDVDIGSNCTTQEFFELCQERIVDTNSSYRYNAKTSRMEEIKHHISETDRMLHQMCNLGFDTTKNSRANKSTRTSEAYKRDVYHESDITAHTVLLYVLYILHTVHIVHVPCFPVSVVCQMLRFHLRTVYSTCK